ncbi:hypothetical protein N657DRAFT_313019 [Parathielavia appendiculata]|uniref:Uncharacterized protein n=1 Tax=Parathielavia appendiculata TaxID=2587402 RepID=A0AAN6U5C7_9PEZI|nr:hypothetical protein N657DRAFT_313019 [Parathielavia appendiculata]
MSRTDQWLFFWIVFLTHSGFTAPSHTKATDEMKISLLLVSLWSTPGVSSGQHTAAKRTHSC